MKLTTAQTVQAATALEAKAVPDNGRMAPELKRLFGDHTFFLGNDGLNILELTETADSGIATARVVKVASWTDAQQTSLSAHPPQQTDVLVELDEAA